MASRPECGTYAVIEPTLTEPLPRVGELRARVDQELWSSVVERPLGQLIEERFATTPYEVWC